MKSLRKAYRGEKGFTLVELLVVVVILGVLAAVATLAVTRFIGSGNLEAAKTELHQAQTAIAAAMADAGVTNIDGVADNETVTWNGASDVIECTPTGGTTVDASEFLQGAEFKAIYTVKGTGEIVGGEANGWDGIQWCTSINGWYDEDATCPTGT